MTTHWLVSGVGQSGATVVHAFLFALLRRAAPDVSAFNEPYLWGPDVWKVESAIEFGEFSFTSSLNARGLAAHLSAPLFFKDSAPPLHDEFADSIFAHPQGPSLAKMIRASGRLGYFLQRYPSLKVVHVVRNPFDCINKQIGELSYFGEEFHPSDRPRLAAERNLSAAGWETECQASAAWWREMNAAALDTARKYPDRVLVFPFEDVESAPKSAASKLLAFLNADASLASALDFECTPDEAAPITLRRDDVAFLKPLAGDYFARLTSLTGLDIAARSEAALAKYAAALPGAFTPAIQRDYTGARLQGMILHERARHELCEQAWERKIAGQQERIAELEDVLAPRLRTVLEMRPLRFVLAERNRRKAEARESAAPPPSDADEGAQFAEAVRMRAKRGQTRERAPSIYTDYKITKPLGIAVFAFDRYDLLANTLESLRLQNAVGDVTLFIDGDQGRLEKRARIDKVEAVARSFAVGDIKRNRGHLGFRKMIIIAMREMMARHERILFLEDDCFPTRTAIKGFSMELDAIDSDPSSFSVYGHPFLTAGEGPAFPRFQGWGWATTREKLRPIWEQLLDCYLMSEEDYLAFVRKALTPQMRRRINATPGRQPTDTLERFFAWDETICLLTAMAGMTHRCAAERIIYNCGVGEDSTHFSAARQFERPPFNMISPREVWRHF